jgi:hypothetical protein
VLAQVQPARDDGIPFIYEIALGVRHGDDALLRRLDEVLIRKRSEIETILDAYGVPRV